MAIQTSNDVDDFHEQLKAILPRLRIYALSLTRDRDAADDLGERQDVVRIGVPVHGVAGEPERERRRGESPVGDSGAVCLTVNDAVGSRWLHPVR